MSQGGTVNDLQVPIDPVTSPNEQPSQEPFVRGEILGGRWLCWPSHTCLSHIPEPQVTFSLSEVLGGLLYFKCSSAVLHYLWHIHILISSKTFKEFSNLYCCDGILVFLHVLCVSLWSVLKHEAVFWEKKLNYDVNKVTWVFQYSSFAQNIFWLQRKCFGQEQEGGSLVHYIHW